MYKKIVRSFFIRYITECWKRVVNKNDKEQEVNCISGLSYEYKGSTNFIFERITNFRGFVTHKKAIIEEIGADDLLVIDKIKSHFKNE